jgi:hypothetical protein
MRALRLADDVGSKLGANHPKNSRGTFSKLHRLMQTLESPTNNEGAEAFYLRR